MKQTFSFTIVNKNEFEQIIGVNLHKPHDFEHLELFGKYQV